MTVAFTNIAHGIPLKAMQTGTFSLTWALSGLTVDGNTGLLVWCGHDQGSVVTFAATPFDYGADSPAGGQAALTAITPAQTESSERHGQWCYLPEIKDAAWDFRANFVNGNTIGAAQIHVWQVTGHNKDSMIGSSASDFANPLTTLAVSSVTAHSGVLVAINDDNSYSNVTVSGSLGGSYIKVDSENTAQSAYDAYNNDIGGTGGTETLTFGGLGTVYMAHAIEVKAASGGGGTIDVAAGATAGASASATLAVQRNLAAAAVAGALATGGLSINKALTAAAIAQAVGSGVLAVFSQVWRIPTNAANGTAVHVAVFNGASPTYGILAQGTAVVAGGYADIPGNGSAGTKAFAFVHNYNDNTATTAIRGGPSIATLTAI